MRLFIAINLPPVEKQRLASELYRLASVNLPIRWLSSDSLHITLKFLGAARDAQRDALLEMLRAAAAGIAPFDVTLQGLGGFPSLNRPKVFWIGAEAPETLHTLQARIEAGCTALGFAPEERPYKPHITIGKTRSHESIRDRNLMDRMAGDFKYKATIQVGSFELMRSHPEPRGARYEVLESVELK